MSDIFAEVQFTNQSLNIFKGLVAYCQITSHISYKIISPIDLSLLVVGHFYDY